MLPSVLMCTSSGLLLGGGRTSIGWPSLGAAASVAIGYFCPATLPAAGAFVVGWSTTAAASSATMLGNFIPDVARLALVSAAGIAVGLLAASPMTSSFLVATVTATPLSALLARSVAARGGSLAVKVVAGWMLAIALLNLILAELPVTPGYLPDHLE